MAAPAMNGPGGHTRPTCPNPTSAIWSGCPQGSSGGPRRQGRWRVSLLKEIMERRPTPSRASGPGIGIMRTGRRYGTERLEAACTHALLMRAHSYKSVESILKNRLDAAGDYGKTGSSPRVPPFGPMVLRVTPNKPEGDRQQYK